MSGSRPALVMALALALDRFGPSPAGDPFMLAEHPVYAPAWTFSADLVLDYAANPLVALRQVQGSTSPVTTDVVSGMLVAHRGLAGARASLSARPITTRSRSTSRPRSGSRWGPRSAT